MGNVSAPEWKYSSVAEIGKELRNVELFHHPGATLLCFDTETTGVDKEKDPHTGNWVAKRDPMTGRRIFDEPTEVSAQKFKVAENGELILVDSLEEYVKPSIPVPQNVEEITGITNEFLSTKPSWHEVHPKIRDFFGNNVVIAHNAPFDVKFMSRMYEREPNDTFRPIAVIDTLALSRYMYPEAKSRKLGDMIDMLQLQHKVDYLCEGEMGYHNSTYDVVALRVLYEALLKELDNRLAKRRIVPYIQYVYYFHGYNRYQPSVVFKTPAGKIEFNFYFSKWVSNEVDLNVVDMVKFENNALEFAHCADIDALKKFREIKEA